MELSRHDYILKCIVDYFIKTATPVGSSTLIEKYDLKYSSATIRNEMALLEAQGLIEKTHSSSGRVPSSKGYRYYVENLRSNDFDNEMKNKLSVILNARAKSVEDVIKDSCEVISDMTHLASLVLGPSANEETLLSVQVVPLSRTSATAVFITDKGYVENKTFILDQSTNIQDVQKCVEMMNTRLKGTPISELIDKMEAMKPIISSYVQSNDVIYRAFMEAFVKFASERVSLFGADNLLEQPEFSSDTEKIKKMLRFIDSPDKIKKAAYSEEDLFIRIGESEDIDEGLQDVTVISKKIPFSGGGKGTIALVGPTRMDYDLVMNALEYLAEELSKFLREERENNEKEEE